MTNRWIIYQRERFPFAAHAPLVAAFSLSAVGFSALLRGAGLPSWRAVVVSYITSLLFFLQLRIADEHKDFDEDARYRPYRPVPRGLVTLRELTTIGVAAVIVQLALALWLSPAMVALLALTWIYFALMTREFFAREWLKARPVVYLLSHMLIMPLIDLYATASDWWPAGHQSPPSGLIWFLIVSFFNGIVIEIGRKIRAPSDEEPGVETYSFLWGPRGAVRAWLGAIGATAIAAVIAATRIEFTAVMSGVLFVLVSACVVAAIRFLRTPSKSSSKTIEVMAGVWTLGLYLGLGVLPLMMRVVLPKILSMRMMP